MRRGLAAAAAIVVVGAGAAAAVLLQDSGTDAATPSPARPLATAEVTREDLVDTKTVDGTLTYSDERRVAAETSGTVTWAPEQGAVVRRGRSLLKVDREPVTLMYGTLPLYRDLYWGVSDGPDVTQLERNLKALGYGDDLDVDDHFSYATYAAVLEWQEDRGLAETGRITAAQVVFLPSAVRVKEVKAEVGDKVRPGQQVLTVSGTDLRIHVDLDAEDQALAREGAKVSVELPGGEQVAGRITEVGKVAETSGSREEESTTIDVEITLDKRPKTRLDHAPVEVELESERHENVLSVPVEALLALREGGFGVEVVEGGRTRIVPVELGAFGSGRVAVEGQGLSEGMKVGVPAG
ncbi:efflux RND transporter periplasmic adaptor subunit [Thermoactinospora rubra]|uniref:efflux RND transporter periplasmic adaptor subunit n=1 Tax=Thermoactinospora rubra TaxID=1088767 RepID=UPI000A112123|nr:peptidoglycan-binding protein [Thermoactinospora rubra]